MKIHNLLAVFVNLIFLSSCLETPSRPFHVDTRSIISPDAARNLAFQEIRKRRLSLPKTCQVQLRDSFADYEFEQSRAIFAVTIYNVRQGKRSDLYTMNIDKKTGNVEDFLDMGTVQPMHLKGR